MVLTVENQRDERKKFTIGKAIRHGTMAGAVLWGAGQAIEARNNHPAEEFARNSSHSQTFSGDIGLAGIAARESRMDVARGPIFPMETFDQLSPLAYAAVLPTPGKRASKKGLLVLAGLSTILASCGGQGVMPTATVEAAPTQPPAITATAPTETPIPYVPPTEGVVPVTPSPEVSTVTLPDYTDFSSEGFLKPIKLSELKKAQSSGDMPAGFTLSAVEAFIQNAEDRLNGLPQKDRENATASVCYRSDLQRNTVLITRNNGDILWLFRGETPSFRPDYPSFATENTGALTYKWVRAGEGDVLCKFDGEFPIIATDTNTTDTHLSSVFQPAEAKFVAAPAVVETPTTAPTPTEVAPKEGDTKIVVENGKDIIYTYRIVKSEDGKEQYHGYFKLVTPKTLPTYDWDTYVPDGKGGYRFGEDILPKQVFIEEGVPDADILYSLTHIQTSDGTVNNEEYMRTLSPQVFKRYYDYFPTAKDNPTWQKLQQELQDGKPDTAQLTITIGGKEYKWSPGPKVGTVVYVIKWDNAAPTPENGFKEWEEPGLNHFRSVFWGIDAKGQLIGAISSQNPLKDLTDIQIREMVLFHDISALYFKDLTDVGYSLPLYDFAESSGAETPPQIIINKNESPAPTTTP